ncbi:hypothetical protein EYB53_022110 [Candidatus Chloroploca sp. M-50]|uniref:Co-chaperone DjlA N-terminal domain-containing protein n=1 Tax=Candidatus Chloroploca mongolica TaxID=2528176 RepID=A0ABS4DG51_9CHLR|nr:TerB family tellurite resistance protein [Candidatus Chloroploca mongolica]MBP1468423.1 hypothetical protein [Candidatus Chloroploca mongolica]
MSDDFWGWAGKMIGKTQYQLEEGRKEADRLTREAQTRLAQAGKAVKATTAQFTKTAAEQAATLAGADSPVAQAAAHLHQQVAGGMEREAINVTTLPDHQRIAFAGALLAMAAADGELDKDELQIIFDVTDLDGLAVNCRRVIQQYLIEPPVFTDTLQPFVHATEMLRFGLMLNLWEVALANDLVSLEQEHLLITAKEELALRDDQYVAIRDFVTELRRIRERGLDDNAAAKLVKNAAAGLAAVGVPLGAVYLSGSVIGLSAAGITSGLAAVGLGFGMVPGIGVAVLLGSGIFVGVRRLLDVGSEQAQERLRAEEMRKAQLVIQHLQEAINVLAERIEALQGAATTAEANREGIVQLTRQIKALEQLIARRKAMEEALS